MSSTDSSSLGTSDIVGIAIGGVIGITMVIGLIFSCYAMFCKKDKAKVAAEPYPPNGPYGQPMNTGYYPQQSPYQQSPYQQSPYQQAPYQQPPYQQPSYNKQPLNNDQPPTYSAVNSNGKY